MTKVDELTHVQRQKKHQTYVSSSLAAGSTTLFPPLAPFARAAPFATSCARAKQGPGWDGNPPSPQKQRRIGGMRSAPCTRKEARWA